MCIYAAENLAAVKDLFVAFGAAGTAAMAYVGLRTWERQLKGTDMYAAARTYAKAAHAMYYAIARYRQQQYTPQEQEAANVAASRSGNKNEAAVRFQAVYGMRQLALNDAALKLEEASIDAQSLLSSDILSLTGAFKDHLDKLRRATIITEAYYLRNFAHQEADTAGHILWSKFDSGADAFQADVLDTLNRVDRALRPYVVAPR